MSKYDLQRFIEKIDQLNQLLENIENNPLRYKELESCSTHNEVVLLAREWGYEIGRRWGEGSP
ncbi:MULTISPECIES: Nif11 family protein [Prochlorococcus]|uniref:Nif11 family protein n=1 Tax=Prochlorococcus TaxID=1218 RepID=UPI0005339831|nr:MULTISPECIES: Nif11 family protein [Prochlorococcus]KGG12163.1 hypothetical protein EV05_1368 [Prochlorococcus sp. MIT 0601]